MQTICGGINGIAIANPMPSAEEAVTPTIGNYVSIKEVIKGGLLVQN